MSYSGHPIQNGQDQVTFSYKIGCVCIDRVQHFPLKNITTWLLPEKGSAKLFHSVQDLHVLPYGYQIPCLFTYTTGLLLYS